VPADAAASDSSHSWILWAVNQGLSLREGHPEPLAEQGLPTPSRTDWLWNNRLGCRRICRLALPSGILKVCTPILSKPQTVPVIEEYIAIKPGYCGGKPHIAGHRIKVQQVAVWHERMGMTPEEIVATYPSITLPAIHAALAYYHGHRAEIDADIDEDRRFFAELQAKAGPSKFKAKLEQLHATDDSPSAGE
jgi:uncharacterized protein (DUF433 family)